MPDAVASQTIGPYWHLLEDKDWADLTRFGAEGERITLIGRVEDGAGEPVTDACVELWQASPASDARFGGFGRCGTDQNGMFRFVTLKPGALPGQGNAQQAPHLALQVFARGLLRGLATRAYFAGEALNELDPLLASIEDPARRGTLIARLGGPATWRLDIRLQGGAETVFLDV